MTVGARWSPTASSITGISGAEFGTRGFIDGWDPATGKKLWRTYSIPTPDEPGGDTWKGDTWKLGGGSTWITELLRCRG